MQWHHGGQSAHSPVECRQEVFTEDKALGSAVNSAVDVAMDGQGCVENSAWGQVC